MSQIKIYAEHETIQQHRKHLSYAIHDALVSAFNYPKEKCFQRFIELDKENFIYPDDRSSFYTIIEISMFEGRSVQAKKMLIQMIFANIQQYCNISSNDVEITIFETPCSHWGIRGKNADELFLNYQLNV